MAILEDSDKFLIQEKVRALYSAERVWYIDDTKEYACYHKELAEFVRMTKPKAGNLLLEVGAGRGRISLSFADKYRKIIALDLSEKMLGALKRYCADKKIENIILIQGDGQLLPFKDDVFNLVIAPEVIGHCPDPVKLMLEIKRVMKNECVGALSTAANYLSIPGLFAQFKSLLNCFFKKKTFSGLVADTKSYLISHRGFWLSKQGYCRDSFFFIKGILKKAQLRIKSVSGAGILPVYLSMRLNIIEKMSARFPFKFFSRVIIVAFEK